MMHLKIKCCFLRISPRKVNNVEFATVFDIAANTMRAYLIQSLSLGQPTYCTATTPPIVLISRNPEATIMQQRFSIDRRKSSIMLLSSLRQLLLIFHSKIHLQDK